MKKKLEVTLIIPNYNNARFLRQCVESAVKQTYPLKEILIVDDKSMDDSADLIRSLEKEYANVRGVFLEKNGGVSNARNKGLEEAKTEYVTYMDADDFYYNEKKIENEAALIRKYRQRGKDILAYSITVSSDPDGNLKKTWSYRFAPKMQFINGNALYQLLSLAKQRRIARDYIIRKEILEQAGAYSFYKNFYEDLDLLMRIAEKNIEFYCTGEHGTCYRESIVGLSRRKAEEHSSTLKEIVDLHYSRLNKTEKIKVYGWKLLGIILNLPFEAKAVLRKLLKK